MIVRDDANDDESYFTRGKRRLNYSFRFCLDGFGLDDVNADEPLLLLLLLLLLLQFVSYMANCNVSSVC